MADHLARGGKVSDPSCLSELVHERLQLDLVKLRSREDADGELEERDEAVAALIPTRGLLPRRARAPSGREGSVVTEP